MLDCWEESEQQWGNADKVKTQHDFMAEKEHKMSQFVKTVNKFLLTAQMLMDKPVP